MIKMILAYLDVSNHIQQKKRRKYQKKKFDLEFYCCEHNNLNVYGKLGVQKQRRRKGEKITGG